jgi:hypothetical protein
VSGWHEACCSLIRGGVALQCALTDLHVASSRLVLGRLGRLWDLRLSLPLQLAVHCGTAARSRAQGRQMRGERLSKAGGSCCVDAATDRSQRFLHPAYAWLHRQPWGSWERRRSSPSHQLQRQTGSRQSARWAAVELLLAEQLSLTDLHVAASCLVLGCIRRLRDLRLGLPVELTVHCTVAQDTRHTDGSAEPTSADTGAGDTVAVYCVRAADESLRSLLPACASLRQ